MLLVPFVKILIFYSCDSNVVYVYSNVTLVLPELISNVVKILTLKIQKMTFYNQWFRSEKMFYFRTPLKLVIVFVTLWLKMFNTYIYLWLIATLKLTQCLIFNKINIIVISITESFLLALSEVFNLFWFQINPFN